MRPTTACSYPRSPATIIADVSLRPAEFCSRRSLIELPTLFVLCTHTHTRTLARSTADSSDDDDDDVEQQRRRRDTFASVNS